MADSRPTELAGYLPGRVHRTDPAAGGRAGRRGHETRRRGTRIRRNRVPGPTSCGRTVTEHPRATQSLDDPGCLYGLMSDNPMKSGAGSVHIAHAEHDGNAEQPCD